MSDSNGNQQLKSSAQPIPESSLLPKEQSWIERLGGLRVVSPSCCLFLLTFACFFPAISYDFVNWDDPWYVIHNSLIQSWSWENLSTISTEVAIRNYAPVTLFSYLVDHTLWGLWPGGYHLTNILFHALNAVLVYTLMLRFVKNRQLAFITAAIFAIHPVQVESVVWISSRKGVLSGFFMLLSLHCWLREERTSRQELWGTAFLVLALLSKIIAVMVPPIVLLYDLFLCRKSKPEAIVRQVVPGLIAAWLLLINMSAQNTELGGIRAHMELSRWEILQVDALILWKYTATLFWPTNLSVLYDPATTGIFWPAMGALFGWAGVAVLAWKVREKYPSVPWLLSSILLLLLPVLNLFPITTLMNDRYLYLPSIPFFALVVCAIAHGGRLLWDKVPRWGGELPQFRQSKAGARWVALLGGLCFVFLLVQKTSQYLPVWNNGMTLWTYTIEQVPQLSVVQIQMANTLHEAGRDTEALEHLEYALNHCDPDEWDRKRILKKMVEWSVQPASAAAERISLETTR